MLHLQNVYPTKAENKADPQPQCICLSNEFIFNIPNGIFYVRMICSVRRLMPTDSFVWRKMIEKHNLMYSFAHQHVKKDLSNSNHIRFVIRIPFHHTNVFIFLWYTFESLLLSGVAREIVILWHKFVVRDYFHCETNTVWGNVSFLRTFM